jgi:hypothetical protein
LSLFFLNIEPAANNSEIYHVEYLQHRRVKIKPPHQKQNYIPQCKRCQACFHNEGYWAHSARCVKYVRTHSNEQCTLPKTQPATCLHYGELRLASYGGRKVYQEIIRTSFLHSKQHQVFILQIYRDKRTKALQHHRKLKDRK